MEPGPTGLMREGRAFVLVHKSARSRQRQNSLRVHAFFWNMAEKHLDKLHIPMATQPKNKEENP